MRNHLYFILFLLLGTSSIAAQESVTTINGHNFHVGDSLTIGLPHEPGEGYQTMGWNRGGMKIPAFAKGKLKKRIIPAKKDFFGDPIGQPQIIYFLSLPQFPKDSLIVYPERAIQKGEIITAPIEHKTLYPEAVELLQEDYIPALIKAGCLTYTDDAIKAYAESTGSPEQLADATSNPFEYQRQRATLLEKLKAAVEKFDLNRVYYVRHKLHTKGYDFTRSGYPWDDRLGYALPFLATKGDLPITPFLTYKKKVPFISVPADRAESFEKRKNTLGLDLQTFYIRAYIRIAPGQKYEEDGSRLYKMEVDYLGLDAYEYPHCGYYHLGSSKAVEMPYHP